MTTKIERHAFVPDPKAVSQICAACKLGASHPVHRMDMIRGNAKPEKFG